MCALAWCSFLPFFFHTIQAPLQAPAGKVVEQRASRQVQYQLTKKDVSKWQALVAANRRAPHLAFDHEQPHAPKNTTATLADKFKPSSNLEQEVAKILNRGGLGSNKGVRRQEVDALQQNEVSIEEVCIVTRCVQSVGLAPCVCCILLSFAFFLHDVQRTCVRCVGGVCRQIKKRQGQLAKLKALLFYDELKRRRANKIKSKAYRRVRKRQERRKEAKAREVGHPTIAHSTDTGLDSVNLTPRMGVCVACL